MHRHLNHENLYLKGDFSLNDISKKEHMNTTTLSFYVTAEDGVVKKISRSVAFFPGKPFKQMHPDICYVFLESSHSVGIIKWGEAGYYKTDWPHNYTSNLVEELNKKAGISPEQAAAMKLCSMNKKLSPAAWYEKYIEILEKFRKRGIF